MNRTSWISRWLDLLKMLSVDGNAQPSSAIGATTSRTAILSTSESALQAKLAYLRATQSHDDCLCSLSSLSGSILRSNRWWFAASRKRVDAVIFIVVFYHTNL